MKKSLVMLLLAMPFVATAQDMYEARKDTVKVPRQPYLRYFTRDGADRKISFYISETSSTAKLPLVVYVQGSGNNSHFIKNNEQIIPLNGHIYLFESLQGKARLLIVEKPGVNYLDNPKETTKNGHFNRQHSLEKWSEAISASIKAAIRSGLADSSKILVVGHSEGGLVACKLGNDLADLVTHVGVFAGGGNSQLYDLIYLARKGSFFNTISDDVLIRTHHVLGEWEKIRAEPYSTSKFFLGFTYLRWASFMQTSCIEQLEHCKAKIFIAQGMKDENLDPSSADQLYAHLLSKNKDVTYDRLENADHSFNEKDNPGFNGWKAETEKILSWFMK